MNNRQGSTSSAIIQKIQTSAYTIPTDAPESDGTIEWNSTTLVLVAIEAGGETGIGYTYSDAATAYFIVHSLSELVEGKDVFENTAITQNLIRQIRNNGTCGTSMMAVSAIDSALWDLKAKLLQLPLCTLLGKVKDQMLLYGSGGLTSYSDEQTGKQFEDWAAQGVKHFKMKIGREPDKDVHRVQAARGIIGENARLFVDANGALSIKQALEKAKAFAEFDVSWFEEPVTSDNLTGLHFIRNHAPAGMNIAAGEYGYHLPYFENMLDAGAVDILQADATRCGGITGFMKAGIICEARQLPFSSHCAPALHLHAALALPGFYIAEYFHAHARIEKMLFEGVALPSDGCLQADTSRTGLGLDFKYADAEKFKVF